MPTKLSFTLGRALLVCCILVIFSFVTGNTSSALSQSKNINSQNSDASSEAKQNIGSINRAQQAYFLENGTYADTIPVLGLGISTQTNNYKYVIVPANPSLLAVTHQARPVRGTRRFNRAVIGGVVTVQGASPNELLSISKVCIAVLPPAQGGARGTESMIFTGNGLACPTGYQQSN